MPYLRAGRPAQSVVSLSQRAGTNVGYVSTANFAFINHVLSGDNQVGPVGNSFNAVSPYTQLIDANNYPNSATASGLGFGGGINLPASADFSGPYVITWDGDGELFINQGTWTESNNTGTTYTKTSNGRWANISGQTAKVIATVSGLSSPGVLASAIFLATGGSSGYARNLRIYRQSDETDLLAGKVFRAAFKQQIADSHLGFFRFMDWHGGNNVHDCRFENRNPPTAAGYNSNSNWAASPKYNAMTDAGGNQYSVAAVSTGAKQTPASMQHGEIATIRASTSAVRGGGVTVQSITKSATPTVTANGHPFSNGDRVLHRITSGMTELDMVVCTVSSVTTNTYAINVNTTSFTTFTSGSVVIDVSLQVGTGSDRTAYPVLFGDGETPAGWYGNYILAPGNPYNNHGMYTFVFDKNINGYGDGSGGYTKGVWIFNNLNGGAHWGGVPLEIITKCIIEINEVSTKPVDLWINVPARGMLSSDPDYSAGSNWASGMMDVIWNGANGYPGLKDYPNINIICEFSNEIWNPTESTAYMRNFSYSRWGSGAGRTNYQDSRAFRAVNAVKDIKAAGFTSPRIKHVYGLWAAVQMEPGGFAANYESYHGSNTVGYPGYYYKRDSYVIAQGWGLPSAEMDGICIAPYIDPPGTYYTTTGAGSLPDDAALYAGTTPYSSPNQAQAITNFVSKMTTAHGGTTTGDFIATIFPSFLNNMPSGKLLLSYEGNHNIPTNAGETYFGHVTTTAESNLITAAVKSAAWGTALANSFTSVCALDNRVKLPTTFIMWAGFLQSPNLRWGYATPTSYESNIEGQAFTNNAAWQAVVSRNSGLA